MFLKFIGGHLQSFERLCNNAFLKDNNVRFERKDRLPVKFRFPTAVAVL